MQIKILYVDDHPELKLSNYLREDLPTFLYSKERKFDISVEALIYPPDESLTWLFNQEKLQSANIIIIDSKLYEERNVSDDLPTGEDFRFLLKSEFPFKVTLVLTKQKDHLREDLGIIEKYNYQKGITPIKYYNEQLGDKIYNACIEVSEYKALSNKTNEDAKQFDEFMFQKAILCEEGNSDYSSLTSADINEVIKIFKEVQELLKNE